MLAATKFVLLAEIDKRGLAMKLGHSTVSRWYARSIRITDGLALRQTALGAWLTDEPSVLNALAHGEIHAAHASAIAEGCDGVVGADPTLSEDHRAAVVAELLETALRGTAGLVTSRAQALAHAAADAARARHDAARARHDAAEKERRDREREHVRRQEDAGGADGAGGSENGPVPDGSDGSGSDGSGSDGSGSGGSDSGSGRPGSGAADGVPAGPRPVPVSENPDLNRLDVRSRGDNRFDIGGNVDRVLAEKLITAVSALSAPKPGPSGERDLRSPSKRRADALDQILDRHLHGRAGGAGGARASVHLTIPLRDLLARKADGGSGSAGDGSAGDGRGSGGAGGGGARGSSTDCGAGGDRNPGAGTGTRGGARGGDGVDGAGSDQNAGPGPGGHGTPEGEPVPDSAASNSGGAGSAGRGKSVPGPGDVDWPFHLDWTGPISRYLVELLACDADLNPVIVDDNGVPLVLGRTIRLANDDQRAAVTVRDRCCVMCGRPAQWCQVHHVQFWTNQGMTDLNNLALVCGECHRLVHSGVWDLYMGEDGHPYAVPPVSVHPDRQPMPSFHRRKLRAA